MIDKLDSMKTENFEGDLTEKLSSLSKELGTKEVIGKGFSTNLDSATIDLFAEWAGCESASILGAASDSIKGCIEQMMNGVTLDGKTTLGLNEISQWKLNPDYITQNIKQQAGYVAEVISTAKDNLNALAENNGFKTYRADDLPELFNKNDQYVDKVVMDSLENIIEKIQVKFVGDDGASCLSKLMSSKFEKYILDGKVDKIEIPKDFYDEIINNKLIEQKLDILTKQLNKVTELGKTEEISKLQNQINKLQKLETMLKRSTVSSIEAIDARLDPSSYMDKIFKKELFNKGTEQAIETGMTAAALTAVISSIDNLPKVMSGEVSAVDALADVAKDTGIAGALGAGTGFVTSVISETMQSSSHQLISSIGNSALPAAVVSFGVQSFDSVVAFVNGSIDIGELTYDLGENAAKVGGGVAGMAVAGAISGSVVPGAGTAAGAVGGLATGLLCSAMGTALAAEAYQTAVEFGSEYIPQVAETLQNKAVATVEIAKEVVPEKIEDIKNSIVQFATEFKLPINLS